jgi:hypothetical protein
MYYIYFSIYNNIIKTDSRYFPQSPALCFTWNLFLTFSTCIKNKTEFFFAFLVQLKKNKFLFILTLFLEAEGRHFEHLL